MWEPHLKEECSQVIWTTNLEMLLRPILTASAFLLALNLLAEDEHNMKRDLDKYDTVTYEMRLSDFEKWPRIKADIRSSLWKHWQGKRLTRLVAKSYTKEGNASDTTYFVEPDRHNIWVIHIYQTDEMHSPRRKSRLNVIEYTAYNLKRIYRRGSHQGKELDTNINAPGNIYFLVLENKAGQVIGKW
jgi:hypothetical protein